MLSAVALLITGLATYYGWQYRQLLVDGTTTTALSISVERRTAGKETPAHRYSYFADYTFADASGAVHRGRHSIGPALYSDLSRTAASAKPTVYYSRSHPQVSVLSRNSPLYAAIFLALLAGGLWITLALRAFRG